VNSLEQIAQLIEKKAQALNCGQLSKEIAAGIILAKLVTMDIERSGREKLSTD